MTLAGAARAPGRPNRVIFDPGSAAAQLQALRGRLGTGVKIYCALKADGYGTGCLPAARALQAAGADGFTLVELADAVLLREHGITLPILVYAGFLFDAEAIALAERHGLILTVVSERQVDLAAASASASGPLALAVKVEVGAERIGVPPAALPALAARIAGHRHLRLAVVNAHPKVRPDLPDVAVRQQFDRFCAATAALPGDARPLRMFAASKVLARGPGMELDAVDPGQMLFGDAEARPIIHHLASRLVQVRQTDPVSVALHTPAGRETVTRIGVIPFGRIDGGDRCHGPEALVGGHRVALLGGASLEYMRLDLSAHPTAAVGDEVVLIGGQDGAEIRLSEVCTAQGGLPASEIAMAIGPRVARSWREQV